MSISRFDYLYHSISTSFYIYIILYLYLYNIDMASRLTAFSIFSYFVDDITSVDSQKFAWVRLLISLWICCLCLILPGSQELPEEELSKTGVVNGPNITRLLGRQSPTGTWKWCSKSPKQDPIIILSCHKWLEKQDLSNNHLGYHQAHMVSLTGWWFQSFKHFLSMIYGMSSFPLTFILFRMVKTTNQ